MDTPIRFVKGIGPRKEKLLKKLGIFSLKDLLYYFPCRYQDRRQLSLIEEVKEGRFYLVKAEPISLQVRKPFRSRKALLEALLKDSSGTILSVWFNQPYLKDYLKKNQFYYFYGKAQRYKGRLQFISPEFEEADFMENSKIKGIVPFYRLTQNLTQKNLRSLIFTCLDKYRDKLLEPLPFEIRKRFGFPNIYQALKNIHFPSDFEKIRQARRRFIFEEFFLLQILIYRRKAEGRLKKREPLNFLPSQIERTKKNLEFTLTEDQEKVLGEIISDIGSPYRTSRLLQGDTGCGKTVVVALTSFLTAINGFQCAFMVPTEVLAFQHKENLKKLAKGLNIRIELISSVTPSKKKKEIFKKVSEGKVGIVVGTHALLNENLKFKNLRFIVIDEQHRFGVGQRALLAKKDQTSSIVIMSATPIPRSLALTLYGDLEVSLIKSYPRQRKPPLSQIIEERDKVYQFIREKVEEGQQAYIIYALVEGEEDSGLESAVKMHKKLTEKFKPFKVGLLHGKLSSSQKEKVLRDFRKGKIKVLVSTSVVEVGVDVPQATVMVVENPERFGLAQLHQLRGRVMRSSQASYFFMVVNKDLPSSVRRRLEVVAKNCDGFKIAEEDLKLRGPGDILGTLQSGYLPKSILQPQQDLELLHKARYSAFQIIKKDPFLQKRENQGIREFLKEEQDRCMLWLGG